MRPPTLSAAQGSATETEAMSALSVYVLVVWAVNNTTSGCKERGIG